MFAARPAELLGAGVVEAAPEVELAPRPEVAPTPRLLTDDADGRIEGLERVLLWALSTQEEAPNENGAPFQWQLSAH